MDLYDAASYHSMVAATEGLAPKTLAMYLTYERRFIAFLEEKQLSRDLAALNALNVRQALLWHQKAGQGSRGGQVATKMFLTVMHVWARFLVREGVLTSDPLERVRPVKVAKIERRPYSRQELNALLAACQQAEPGQRPWPARNEAILYLLMDTGMRVGELATLPLANVSTVERRVTVSTAGKGRKERTLPFGDARVQDGGPGLRALRAYLKERAALMERHPGREHGRLLVTFAGFPMTGRGVENLIARLGALEGVDNAIPHRFRHFFATWYLVTYPGDELGLRRLLGHVSRDAMADYVHLSTLILRERAGQAMPSRGLVHDPPQRSRTALARNAW